MSVLLEYGQPLRLKGGRSQLVNSPLETHFVRAHSPPKTSNSGHSEAPEEELVPGAQGGDEGVPITEDADWAKMSHKQRKRQFHEEMMGGLTEDGSEEEPQTKVLTDSQLQKELDRVRRRVSMSQDVDRPQKLKKRSRARQQKINMRKDNRGNWSTTGPAPAKLSELSEAEAVNSSVISSHKDSKVARAADQGLKTVLQLSDPEEIKMQKRIRKRLLRMVDEEEKNTSYLFPSVTVLTGETSATSSGSDFAFEWDTLPPNIARSKTNRSVVLDAVVKTTHGDGLDYPSASFALWGSAGPSNTSSRWSIRVDKLQSQMCLGLLSIPYAPAHCEAVELKTKGWLLRSDGTIFRTGRYLITLNT